MSLATSSIAIATSIGCPSFHNDQPASSDQQRVGHTCNRDREVTGQQLGSNRAVDSAWYTAYNAAKVAINAIKESSDIFPPLKAVVGALSVIIKNYDVSIVLAIAELLD